MGNGCIYCGEMENLSKSDIIPDALTNAKIINPNVCKTEHNNKFSDLFEYEVINKLGILTNHLNIKSSKGKNYASYAAKINVGDIDYNTNITSKTELFSGDKRMRSVDGKILFGPIDELKKIAKKNDSSIKEIDVNEIEIETRVSFDLEVFFSEAMQRLVAKVAFEWYCVKNKVNSKNDNFNSIIDFIIESKGEGIVSVVSNPQIYKVFNETIDFGSHALLSYISNDGSINVLVDLFGVSIYNVRVCERIIDDCKKNVMFQELTLDAKHHNFEFVDIRSLGEDFHDSIIPVTHNTTSMDTKIMTPKVFFDTTLKYKMMYLTNYNLFLEGLNLKLQPTDELVELIINNVQHLFQVSAITVRGLKRFVKEHRKYFDEGFKLNINGTDKDSVFLYYILYIIGESNGQIKNLQDLNKILQKNFISDSIILNDDLFNKLHEELLGSESSTELIIQGAKIVESFKYE